MSEAKRFFLPLAFLAGPILVFYLIFTSADFSRKTEPTGESGQIKIDLGLLEKNYKTQTKVILANYLRLAQDEESLNIEQVRQTREQLLALKVPTQFKDLHLNLVLALTKMEDFLTGGDREKKIASQQLINEAKANYIWLN